MEIKYAERIKKLPPYLFVEIDQKKKKAIKKGKDVIDLGVGDPDLPTPQHIIEAAKKAVDKPENHRYPFGAGLIELRKAVTRWYKNRFRVKLDPESEVHSLLGAKEGLGHLPLAFVGAGDFVLCPEPGYPVYNAGTILAGAMPYFMPLKKENNFLPDFSSIPEEIAQGTKLMFLNYPNNPTASCASVDFFKEVVRFAKKYNIMVVHDATYTEIYFDQPPISFLQVSGAKDVGVEFHSLSKTYRMTGWRIGFVVGNAEIIKGLANVKSNLDSGVFQVVQEAGIAALTGPQDCVEEQRDIYRQRRDILVNGLKEAGWDVDLPLATFYVWAKVPEGYNSQKCAEKLLDEVNVVVTPGNGMGPSGEGYVRMSLTVAAERLEEAVRRIKSLKW